MSELAVPAGPSGESAPLSLRLRVPAEAVVEFSPLFQAGYFVSARTGCSVKDLLCNQFGIDEEYVTMRITTLFLDSKPVDRIDTALVRDGATLALSSAMPGLVGATLRRGGFYAAFREGISCKDDDTEARIGVGTVRIKLFNLLIRELGPLFLKRGIIVPASAVADLFVKSSPGFRNSCSDLSLDGKPAEVTALADGTPFRDQEHVRLAVVFHEPLPVTA